MKRHVSELELVQNDNNRLLSIPFKFRDFQWTSQSQSLGLETNKEQTSRINKRFHIDDNIRI